VLFVSKDAPETASGEDQSAVASTIPPGSHYVDLTQPDTVVVLSQPPEHRCAVLGGIMALRMKVRGAKGVVVGGRLRDLTELRGLGLPVG